jgi:hypothetical protein
MCGFTGEIKKVCVSCKGIKGAECAKSNA